LIFLDKSPAEVGKYLFEAVALAFDHFPSIQKMDITQEQDPETAVFNLGYNYLKDLGFTIPKNHEAHKEVCRHFNNSSDGDLVRVATKKINETELLKR